MQGLKGLAGAPVADAAMVALLAEYCVSSS